MSPPSRNTIASGSGATAQLKSRLQGNRRLDNVIGYLIETTIVLSHLIFDATLDRFRASRSSPRTAALVRRALGRWPPDAAHAKVAILEGNAARVLRVDVQA